MSDLLVIVPTRERPASAERLLSAWHDTVQGDAHLLFGCDEDDPTLAMYESLGHPMVVKSGLRDVVAWVNVVAVENVTRFDALGHIGDDNVPTTPGWDLQVMDALTRVPFTYGDDKIHRQGLCCHVFMRSEVVESLGYFGPPRIKHMYVDPVWLAWGESAGIEYLPGVDMEHLHYVFGRSNKDAVYDLSLAKTAPDAIAFCDYIRDPEGLNADLIKLGCPPWSAEQIEAYKERMNVPG